MSKKLNNYKNNYKKKIHNEHLEEYLKSSYAERLNWLEEANRFINTIKSSKSTVRKK